MLHRPTFIGQIAGCCKPVFRFGALILRKHDGRTVTVDRFLSCGVTYKSTCRAGIRVGGSGGQVLAGRCVIVEFAPVDGLERRI
ncbi:MAG: hypothetical protein RXR20_02640, partial [Paraburkholderia sp.]